MTKRVIIRIWMLISWQVSPPVRYKSKKAFIPVRRKKPLLIYTWQDGKTYQEIKKIMNYEWGQVPKVWSLKCLKFEKLRITNYELRKVPSVWKITNYELRKVPRVGRKIMNYELWMGDILLLSVNKYSVNY